MNMQALGETIFDIFYLGGVITLGIIMILAKDGIHSYEEIAANTYRIDEKGLVNTYLLIGERKALLIDSGVGVGDLLSTVKELTSLPVTLALTHRHCDHAGGVNFFKTYYVHQDDKPMQAIRKELRKDVKRFGHFTLVDIKSADGESVLIRL